MLALGNIWLILGKAFPHFAQCHNKNPSYLQVYGIEKYSSLWRGSSIKRQFSRREIRWIFDLQTHQPWGLNVKWDVNTFLNNSQHSRALHHSLIIPPLFPFLHVLFSVCIFRILINLFLVLYFFYIYYMFFISFFFFLLFYMYFLKSIIPYYQQYF